MIVRLYALADHYWPLIDAHYLPVNLLDLPMYRFLNAIWTWCIQRVEPDKIDQWEMMMSEPLPGQAGKKPSPFTEEEEGAGFMAAMAALGAR